VIAGDTVSALRFRVCMIGVVALAVAIQLRFIDVSVGSALSPVGRYARTQAYWMVRGDWFVNPLGRVDPARSVSALHPPLTSLLLGAADVAGADGVTAQRVLFALIFCAAVVVAGLTVRLLAGDRAAVLAALVVATMPSLWVNPASLGAETLVIALTVLLLFASVRFRQRPDVAGAAEIGAYLGLALLTRADLAALVVVVVPVVLAARRLSWFERVKLSGVVVAVAVIIVSPWAVRNLATFSGTTLVSDDAGSVLAGANCATTYEGSLVGWWSGECVTRAARTVDAVRPVRPVRPARPARATSQARRLPAAGDQAVVAGKESRLGRRYATDHLGAFLRVGLIRIGRMWDVFHPFGQSRLEAGVGRPVWVSDLSVWYLYALVPLAVLGGAVLWLRKAPVFPFAGLVVLSTCTAFVAYGDARFRVEADVALAMLGGVALDWLWRRGNHHVRRARAGRMAAS